MSKKPITVFTPTYNRADLLPNAYEALKQQTSADFLWLIVDDGSTDNTEELVSEWIDDQAIEIRYIKKENGGLHTGYNKAIELMDTELCICIDSDDTLPPRAVETILECWHANKDTHCAGIIGLDFADGKEPIGGRFPENVHRGHMTDLSIRHRHRGDTKIVCRVDLLKQHWPMPTLHGEKNFNPIYYYLKVDEDHDFIYLNENLCNVYYQTDGMTANIFNQFWNSPYSFAAIREQTMSMKRLPWSHRFKNAIHYASSCCIARDFKLFRATTHKGMVSLALPMGALLYCYIRWKKL